MLRRFLAAALVVAALAFSPNASIAAPGTTIVAQVAMPALFASEDAAQAHCPRDVWLNVPSGIYHYKGERWYGRAKHGAYACEKEAIAAGDRATENGQ